MTEEVGKRWAGSRGLWRRTVKKGNVKIYKKRPLGIGNVFTG